MDKIRITPEIDHFAKTISNNQAFCKKQGSCKKCVLYTQDKCDYVLSAAQCMEAGYRLVDNKRVFEFPAKVGDPYYTVEWFCTQSGEYSELTQVSLSSCENCCEECDGVQRIVTNHFQSLEHITRLQRSFGTYYYLSYEDARIALLKSKYKEATSKTKILGIGRDIKVYNKLSQELHELLAFGGAIQFTFKDGAIIKAYQKRDGLWAIVVEQVGSSRYELTTCNLSKQQLLQKGIEDIDGDVFEIDSELYSYSFVKK